MAQGQGDTYTSHTQSLHLNASDFFHNLDANMKKIAEQEAEAMTDTMVRVLHNRLGMGTGNGKFPRWNPSAPDADGKRYGGKSKKMFSTWYKQRRPRGEFWIATDGIDPEHYNYALNLMYGRGWSDRVMNGRHVNLVPGPGGGLFSKQMPKGISPWIIEKRRLFEEKIRERDLRNA